MKTKLLLLSAFFLVAALAFTFTASAAIPHLMNFQGKATDKTGAPLSGTYNLTFRIYNSETGGTAKWSETQPSIPISNGIFQVQLGSVTALSLSFDEPYWISIEINTDGEMSPRTKLASVPYAYTAENAAKAELAVTTSIPFYITGFELECVSPHYIKIGPGSADINDLILTDRNYSPLIDINDSSNYLAGHSNPNPWIYVYIYNDNDAVAYLLADTAPDKSDNKGNTDGAKRYYIEGSIVYRCIGAVRKNAQGGIMRFFQNGDLIMWDVPISITTTKSANAWSPAISCASAMPAISQLAHFRMSIGMSQSDDRASGSIRPSGSTYDTPGDYNSLGGDIGDGYMISKGQIISFTDASQRIQHYEFQNAGDNIENFAILLLGYRLSR